MQDCASDKLQSTLDLSLLLRPAIRLILVLSATSSVLLLVMVVMHARWDEVKVFLKASVPQLGHAGTTWLRLCIINDISTPSSVLLYLIRPGKASLKHGFRHEVIHKIIIVHDLFPVEVVVVVIIVHIVLIHVVLLLLITILIRIVDHLVPILGHHGDIGGWVATGLIIVSTHLILFAVVVIFVFDMVLDVAVFLIIDILPVIVICFLSIWLNSRVISLSFCRLWLSLIRWLWVILSIVWLWFLHFLLNYWVVLLDDCFVGILFLLGRCWVELEARTNLLNEMDIRCLWLWWLLTSTKCRGIRWPLLILATFSL